MATVAKELPACPVETTLTLISDKWKVLVLRDLMPGTKRFGELKKSIGNVSQKVLTAQLRQMEENGLLIRTVYNGHCADNKAQINELLAAFDVNPTLYRLLCKKDNTISE